MEAAWRQAVMKLRVDCERAAFRVAGLTVFAAAVALAIPTFAMHMCVQLMARLSDWLLEKA